MKIFLDVFVLEAYRYSYANSGDLCLEYSFLKSQQNWADWSSILSLEPQNNKGRHSAATERQTGFRYVPSALMIWPTWHENSSEPHTQQISLQKKTYSHFTQIQQPAPLSLSARGILRLWLRTESLNIGAPSQHLGLVLEYFTQELRIFYQAITIVCSRRDFSSCKSGTSFGNKPEPLCCTNNIHLLLLDFQRIPGFIPQTRA